MQDRRKGPDSLVKWVKYSGIVSWVLIAIILFITLVAKPNYESFMNNSFHIRLNDVWDIQILQYVFLLLVLLFFFCMISIVINLMRYRRKSDRFNKTLILNAVASFIGIILYIVIFV